MNVALDTNAYSDFMRGAAERVELVRTVQAIVLPLIVLGELRAGFAAGNRGSTNAANLQRSWPALGCPCSRPTNMTTHYYAQLHRQLRDDGRPIPTTTSGPRPSAVQHDLVLGTMRRPHPFRVELSCILEALPSGLSAAGVGARGLMRRQIALSSSTSTVPRREPLGAFTAQFRAD